MPNFNFKCILNNSAQHIKIILKNLNDFQTYNFQYFQLIFYFQTYDLRLATCRITITSEVQIYHYFSDCICCFSFFLQLGKILSV